MIKIAATVLAGSALLAGCGGGSGNATPAASVPTASAPATGGAGHMVELKVAAQGYVDSLLRGDVAGITGYLDPKVCDEAAQTSFPLAVGAISQTAGGATMKVTKVYAEGDRGGVEDYSLSNGAPDQLRRLIKSSFGGGRTYSWRFHDGEWYLAGPCEGESVSASPAA